MSYTINATLKSKGTAAILALLLGPIGLFYATITGGVIMTFIVPLLLFIFFFFGLFSIYSSIIFFLLIITCCIYNIICLIWALNAVSNYNQKLIQEFENLNQTASSNSSIQDDIINAKNEIYGKMERIKKLLDQNIILQSDYSSQQSALQVKLDRLSENESSHNNGFNQSSDNIIAGYPTERKSNVWIWILTILLLLSFLFIFYNAKTNSFNLSKAIEIFDTHKREKEEIKDQIEKTYFGLLNGAYTAKNMSGIGANGLPFYNQNLANVTAMGLLPLVNLMGVNVSIEPKNIDVYNFIDDNSAQVKYDLIVTAGDHRDSGRIEMIVKKIGGSWKLDGANFMNEKKSKSKAH